MKKIKALLITLCATITLSIAGCGEDTTLIEYKEKMEHFYEQLHYYGRDLDSLNPDSDTAIDEMLSHLEGISILIKEMATYEVPDVFLGVEELAEQADKYMTESLRLYNEAFLAAEYNDNITEAAYENYERVNLRLRYIADILSGDIPEEIFTN